MFIRERPEGVKARLIDLEKMRGIWFPERDRVKDMEQFVRHTQVLSEAEIMFLLGIYLDASPEGAITARFLEKLRLRQKKKKDRT